MGYPITILSGVDILFRSQKAETFVDVIDDESLGK